MRMTKKLDPLLELKLALLPIEELWKLAEKYADKLGRNYDDR